ncbi:hypothetical protein GM415_01015 [Pseudodesulfovibrio cashew]|uniref:Tetratricopeptide repeat protein n=1 Tax=Pseudodesulfovibrio cashew TaxID=2678688 RepID=A0A6I6JM56_9BACT|nr:tetratricopeptide repeat protein [Pseudodesulfovibrio cashew]QGY38774.1 hypothetical protein GM415_01015 [Pseudodesulfovibrio cashew]
MNKIVLLLVALIATVVLSLSALAVSPVRSGEKNFERAWKSLMTRNADKAAQYFGTAADAFAEALAGDPPSRTTRFPSNLTKAGMSLYYAGRYKESIDALNRIPEREKDMWEAALYRALSYGRLGDREAMVRWLNIYLDLYPSQPILSSEVQRQLDGLDSGSAAPDAAAAALDDSAIKQFRNNVLVKQKGSLAGPENCNGAFWWRNYRAPCTQKQFEDE